MVSVIIPTLNAEDHIQKLFTSLKEQSISIEIIVIDSSSSDNTVKIAESYGVKTMIIKREDFDHGGTRNLAVNYTRGETLVFLTQDVLPVDEYALERLKEPFYSDEKIGAAYGRQLPRPNANTIEAHARLFNYPPKSQIKTLKDAPKLGIKTAFISNSFAAYRRTALISVGGFPSNTILGEDTYVAAKMLLSGWKVAYCAEAKVYHSHNYNYIKEFSRYFNTGVFHAREPWIRQSFAQAEGEGMRYVRSELKYLWDENYKLIPSAAFRTALKFLAYRLGLMERKIPKWLKVRLSMNKLYWEKDNRRVSAG